MNVTNGTIFSYIDNETMEQPDLSTIGIIFIFLFWFIIIIACMGGRFWLKIMCIEVSYTCQHLKLFYCGFKKCSIVLLPELEDCAECCGLQVQAGYNEAPACDGLTFSLFQGFGNVSTHVGFNLRSIYRQKNIKK